ncbi:dihydrofolate reductase family protein [Microbacterium sp. B2969]|uniref:Dihydrofolate reductase family protein n=1 Tax=Microbacterium alkaliflavum TaxID=3248839 RepID=A0ABW7QD58_9MICO
MGRLIVVQFITLDGVVEDPDGSDGAAFGGWAMRFGPQGVAGDKFRLGDMLETGVLLFGRRTWEHFSTLWPRRDDDFSQAMNRASKAVVTHEAVDPDQWSHSEAVTGALEDWVAETLTTRDIVVIGSGSVVTRLREADLVDEYRLLTFPLATGAGRALFPDAAQLTLDSVEQVGPGNLAIYSARV